MKQPCPAVTVAAVFLLVGCSPAPNFAPDLQTLTLQCRVYEGEIFGFYSFTEGEITQPEDRKRVDIIYYFDNDDCSEGALIGRDDRPEYLFPIGHKSWRELMTLEPPTEESEPVGGIMSITKDKEGLAFWVKTHSGEYILTRIKTVQPATYSDMISGGTATVELEWTRPHAD